MTDKPALRPDLAVGEALRSVARQIVADARAAVSDPTRTDAEAVHDFRKEMKRWRAFLRLIDPFIEEEGASLRTHARDLARALGGARDAQSSLDALDDLAGHGLDLPDRSVATLRGHIETMRQAAETTVLNDDMRIQLADALDKADAAIERWPLHVLTFPEVAEQLARGFRAARRMLPKDWKAADAESLHELRKHVVTHRYQMEIVEPLWPRFVRMWLGEAQRLRDRLGKHQDLLVLAKLTGPHQPLARWRSRLSPAIDKRKAAHVTTARRIATRIFVEKPRAFRRRLEAMWEAGG